MATASKETGLTPRQAAQRVQGWFRLPQKWLMESDLWQDEQICSCAIVGRPQVHRKSDRKSVARSDYVVATPARKHMMVDRRRHSEDTSV